MSIWERYQSDPAFRGLVDQMQVAIERAEFTPTEIREAAMLAQIMFEDKHPRLIQFTKQDVRRAARWGARI